jgi:hypothetical protein
VLVIVVVGIFWGISSLRRLRSVPQAQPLAATQPSSATSARILIAIPEADPLTASSTQRRATIRRATCEYPQGIGDNESGEVERGES